MSEIVEVYRFLADERRKNGMRRRVHAKTELCEARAFATENGLVVRCCVDGVHYQISPADGRWLLNFYPGNARLYADRNKPEMPPFIGWPEGGAHPGLRHVVNELVRLTAVKT